MFAPRFGKRRSHKGQLAVAEPLILVSRHDRNLDHLPTLSSNWLTDYSTPPGRSPTNSTTVYTRLGRTLVGDRRLERCLGSIQARCRFGVAAKLTRNGPEAPLKFTEKLLAIFTRQNYLALVSDQRVDDAFTVYTSGTTDVGIPWIRREPR